MTEMIRLRSVVIAAVVAMTLLFAAAPVTAQRYVPKPNDQPTLELYKDTSMLKPPAGAKIAIYELADMECPACAHAYPIVHAAMAHYNIPLVYKDFPLRQHIWSFDCAVWARYLQDKVSAKAADEYRGAVFAAQTGIASTDDMVNFTQKYFRSHGFNVPFVVDPTGQLKKEVEADRTLGEKLGVEYTPSIVVCTQKEWVHVTDIQYLYSTIDELEAKVKAETPARRATPPVTKPATAK
ncbi:MAG: thioredoxin domain-containing protein [Acidobacteriaceae bacterium]|jgi:protein-disulfide isomerase